MFPWNSTTTPSGGIDDYAALPLAKSVVLGPQGGSDMVKSITMSGTLAKMMATIPAVEP